MFMNPGLNLICIFTLVLCLKLMVRLDHLGLVKVSGCINTVQEHLWSSSHSLLCSLNKLQSVLSQLCELYMVVLNSLK